MKLSETLEILNRSDASEEMLGSALHDLGEKGDSSLHRHVAPFLAHSSPQLRHMALTVLGFHWVLPQYRERFEEMLLNDPEEYGFVRQTAASCLGIVLRGTRDKKAARLLVNKVRDESERGNVREAAYEALLEIWSPDSTYRDYARSVIRRTEEQQRLLEKANEARERSEMHAALALATEAENAWRNGVDWKLVDTIGKELA